MAPMLDSTILDQWWLQTQADRKEASSMRGVEDYGHLDTSQSSVHLTPCENESEFIE